MQLKRILVPIDGSSLSLRAAELAGQLAGKFDACVLLVNAVEPPEAVRPYVSAAAMEEIRRGVYQAAEQMLEQAAARVRPLCPSVDTRILCGAPAAAIAKEADTGYDLIVMGSRGLGLAPVDRGMLGSVAERVLRQTLCPVLIVPEHPQG